MKNQVLALSILLSSTASFAAPNAATLAQCRASAVKVVSAVLASKQITSDALEVTAADANEKNVKIISHDKATGAPKYRFTYSAVNREVGFNMEGEWKLIADVQTEIGEGDASNEGCGVSNLKLGMTLPKEIVK